MIPDNTLNAILVRIKIPGLALAATNPGCLINALAGGILSDFLTTELTVADLLTHRPPGGKMAFLGWFCFEVNDVQRAGATVWNVLQRNGLDTWATVFRADTDEGVFRSIYPRGIVMLTGDVVAEQKACAAEAANVLALWKQVRGGPNPSESDASKQ
jgi:hypothetical protein